jgi:hypothetical protein
MSETQDKLIYNFYDFLKTIFVYSHVKTYLIDPKRQNYELFFDGFLLGISIVFMASEFFKIFTIYVYFFFVRTICALINFIKVLKQSKCKIDFCQSFKNGIIHFAKDSKRFCTFNFYLFENNWIGFIMIFFYLLFLISSFIFFIMNFIEIKLPEKTEGYLVMFYIHFLSFVLIQLLCTSFYACRNTKIAIISAFVIFLFLFCLTIIGYKITETLEDVVGKFEIDYPQQVMNIIYNSIFLLLNGNCFYNFWTYKKEGK